jgi:hypothetical protein
VKYQDDETPIESQMAFPAEFISWKAKICHKFAGMFLFQTLCNISSIKGSNPDTYFRITSKGAA